MKENGINIIHSPLNLQRVHKMNVPTKILEDCCTHMKTMYVGTMCSTVGKKKKKGKASDCSATAFQISFISMLKHFVEGIICNGITDGFKSEETKAVIARTRAAIISIKCMEAHQTKKNLCMAQEKMQSLTQD